MNSIHTVHAGNYRFCVFVCQSTHRVPSCVCECTCLCLILSPILLWSFCFFTHPAAYIKTHTQAHTHTLVLSCSQQTDDLLFKVLMSCFLQSPQHLASRALQRSRCRLCCCYETNGNLSGEQSLLFLKMVVCCKMMHHGT